MAIDPVVQSRDFAPAGAGAGDGPGRVFALAELHGSLSDPLLDTMNFLNEITSRFPAAISLAPGRPFEELFDVSCIPEYLSVYTDHLRARGHSERQVRTALFQYGRTKGQIHELVTEMLANDEGIRVPPEAVVMTVGAQEGMFLTLRALLPDPQDVLLVSSPCYIGITGAARLLDIELVPVPEGPAGPDPEAVAKSGTT
jgi:(S)-3,5-dihydroxyphenylglycine transaminase